MTKQFGRQPQARSAQLRSSLQLLWACTNTAFALGCRGWQRPSRLLPYTLSERVPSAECFREKRIKRDWFLRFCVR